MHSDRRLCVAGKRASAVGRGAQIAEFSFRCLRILLTACQAVLDPQIGLVFLVEPGGACAADQVHAHADRGVAGRSDRSQQAARVSRALW